MTMIQVPMRHIFMKNVQ